MKRTCQSTGTNDDENQIPPTPPLAKGGRGDFQRKKLVEIIGARPQFIKMAVISRAIRKEEKERKDISETIIHTGQHYDDNMSTFFFKELDIPEPDYNLNVGSASHGKQTGIMMERIEDAILRECPDIILVYGDTNSTLAGAIVGAKLHIPIGHVEAGLRSFNKRMPEEINRILTDHVSTLLFCPTETSVQHLKREGITKGIHHVGDVMYDSVLFHLKQAEERSDILYRLNLRSMDYILLTVHRAENTDSIEDLMSIFSACKEIDMPIIFPVHPRTKRYMVQPLDNKIPKNLFCIDPVSYLDMLILEKNARIIMTDSGGVQKEAYFCKVPCVTLRDETEWIETVDSGWNRITGIDKEEIIRGVKEGLTNYPLSSQDSLVYGDGNAGEGIVDIIRNYLSTGL